MPGMPGSVGELDRRINIESRSVAREATYGSEVETWTPAASDTWAKVWQSSTAAGLGAGQGESVATYARPTRVWVRWRAGITRANHRIRYAGQLLRILGVAEIGRQEWLELSCAEWSHE
jgi:SPP1 family predicted phage head-tail adaptor